MFFKIDKDSPLPIYFQLEEGVKESIERGDLKPGDLIPSEREFSERFEISRMTVRQAINNLVSNGYLVRKQGRGTFVAQQKIEQKLKGLTSFSEDMRSRGMTPSTKLLEFRQVAAAKPIADKLMLDEGAIVYEIKRLRLADDTPMALETSYLPAELVAGFDKDAAQGSLYDYIEKVLGLKIGFATQVLEASIAKGLECKILEIKEGTPVLLIKRYTNLENGQPLEVVHSVYPGSRYKFVIDMQRTKYDN
jgi:GntR family transcriptional regulator